jgi:hypothetical protein
LFENKIADEKELVKFASLKTLKKLNMLETPLATDKGDEFKKEVLIALDCLTWTDINEEEVVGEDVEAAAEEKKERFAAAKEAEEEAARLKAEQEAEGAVVEEDD